MEGTVLMMPFLDETNSFCNGFETGRMWHQCSIGETIEEQPIRNENIAQIKLLLDHHGYQFRIETMDDFWSQLTAKPIDISSVTN